MEISDRIRIIESRNKDVAMNLALEEALLELVNKCMSPSSFRIWSTRPCAIISFNQSIFDLIDVKYCLDFGIELNRRITGGGAIYSDEGNLNWSFYLKRKSFEKLSIVELYRTIANIIIEGLYRTAAIKAQFHEPNWIGIKGNKISGMAGYIKKNAILIHGTFLVFTNQARLATVCKRHLEYPPTMNIIELSPNFTIEDARNALKEGVRRKFKEYYEDELNEEEKELASKLVEEKYTNLSWIFLK